MSNKGDYDKVINETLKLLKATILPVDYDGFRELCVKIMKDNGSNKMNGLIVNDALNLWKNNGYQQPKDKSEKQVSEVVHKEAHKDVHKVPKVINLLEDINGGLNDDAAFEKVLEMSRREDSEREALEREALEREAPKQKHIKNLEMVDEDEFRVLFLSRFQDESELQSELRSLLYDCFKEFQKQLFDNVEEEDIGCYCKKLKKLIHKGILCHKSMDELKDKLQESHKERELEKEVNNLKEIIKFHSKNLSENTFDIIKRYIEKVANNYDVKPNRIVKRLKEIDCPLIDTIEVMFGKVSVKKPKKIVQANSEEADELVLDDD